MAKSISVINSSVFSEEYSISDENTLAISQRDSKRFSCKLKYICIIHDAHIRLKDIQVSKL